MFMKTGCGTENGNCNNADALFWLQERPHCETGSLHRKVAGLTFLASFAREVNASLNPREVVLAAAKLLNNYFHYDLAVFSIPPDSGGVTAFSPLDAVGFMRGFLMARESFPDLKPKEINGYRHLGLATPGHSRVPGNYPAVVEIAGEGMKITLYCDEEAEGKATHDLMTGIAESLTTALRNALEHGRMKELSLRDSLTGLYNRRVLEEFLDVEERKRTPAPSAILIIDIDDFKAINDTFGHPAGDRVLSVFGKLMQDNCRRENIVARYGGEEFAVLLTNSGLTAASALKIAERLRTVLGAQDFAFSGRKVRVTVSVGVAYSTGNMVAPEILLARADQALYHAKRSGKNRVCLHEAKHIQIEKPTKIVDKNEPTRLVQPTQKTSRPISNVRGNPLSK
jgi:two-component system cell cycle response regulator